jgi:DNA-binding GntR family transcriptional regulator
MTRTLEKLGKAVPKYLHIYEDLHRQIQTGALKPGDRLPSFSELRTACDAMPATVDRAYARLERENLVTRQARRGVFVAERSASFTGNIGLIIHSSNCACRYS